MNRIEDLCAGGQIGGARPYQEDYFRYRAAPRSGGGSDALLVLIRTGVFELRVTRYTV